jgi:hypothetical protein
MTLRASDLLRRALLADAVVSGTTAAALIVFADAAATLFGVPAALLRMVGLILVPFAAVVLIIARRPDVGRRSILAVIVCNALWAVDSILLLLTGWVEPTPIGYAFVVGQALIVAAFAEVQYVGMRRAMARI